MKRIHVICEGQTEEMFIKELLFDPFQAKGIVLIPALVGKPGHKGGNFRINRLLRDVRNRLLGDTSSFCTTFFDFYGLPKEFPGKMVSDRAVNPQEKAAIVCNAIVESLTAGIGEDAMQRFIPYIQMFEFEALLFSDPEGLARGIDCPEMGDTFRSIRESFESPEWINDNPLTAPSKRISRQVVGYGKPIYGSLAALEIGLSIMRRECHRFDAWLKKLEKLAEVQE